MKSKKKSYNSKKRQSLIVTLVILLVMMIGIGYASLSRSLKITGSSTIKGQTWNIYFDESSINSTKTSTVTINSAPIVSADGNGYKTQVTYDVTLSQPGDYFEFTVDLLNAGSIDAKLSADPTITAVSSLGSDVSNYFDYTVKEVVDSNTEQTITKNNFSLVGGTTSSPTTKKIKVRIEYKEDITDSDLQTKNVTFNNLTFEMNFEQA